MSSWWYLVDVGKTAEELNPLLPHIAGVIENVEEATFYDIKEQIETDLEKKVSDTEIVKALENGIKLGVFNVQREFKVCREFTTKELKKSRQVVNPNPLPGFNQVQCLPLQDKNLMNYVKSQREKRRNKLHKKGKKGMMNTFSNKTTKGNVQLYKYLCRKCKRSVEREIMNKENSGTSSGEDNERDSVPSVLSMATSTNSGNSHAETNFSEKLEKPSEKSRLLVERNPMETDPPYYDIFT